jgi:hypothetical protein
VRLTLAAALYDAALCLALPALSSRLQAAVGQQQQQQQQQQQPASH